MNEQGKHRKRQQCFLDKSNCSTVVILSAFIGFQKILISNPCGRYTAASLSRVFDQHQTGCQPRWLTVPVPGTFTTVTFAFAQELKALVLTPPCSLFLEASAGFTESFCF